MKHTVKLLTGIAIIFAFCQPLWASTTSEVYISCTVASFGGYTFKGYITAPANKPGSNKIGYINVEGASNEPYPWIMRVYTDNKNYQGLAGAFHREKNNIGLIREGGGYLPLQFRTPNTGDEWVYVPDINYPKHISYFALRDMGPGAIAPSDSIRDVVVMGIDPRNADWVAGRDRILFTDDDNFYGDITIGAPFKIELAVMMPPIGETTTTPSGKYSTKLIFEIISEP